MAVSSIMSRSVRMLYASGARLVLLVGTKFVCKVATIVALTLWRDTPPSSFCRWYLPVDGAVLLWQAHVAPVGAAAQATIAAADAACTFCCCWLLSDRWPYDNLSAGTVLAVQLLLTSASLWLAERMEQCDRRDFERSVAVTAARGGAPLPAAGDGGGLEEPSLGKAPRYLQGAGALAPGGCGVTCCGGGGGGSSADGAGGLHGGKGMGTRLLSHAGVVCEEASEGTPVPQPARQLQQPRQQEQQRETSGSMDECGCLASVPMTYTGSASASSSGGGLGGGGPGPGPGSCSAGSGACCCGTACSETSPPATLSDTPSLSHGLPSFSTISNCSTCGGGAGGGGGGSSISAAGLTETACCSSTKSLSRPSSCVGALLAGRAPGQTQSQTAPTGSALILVAGTSGRAGVVNSPATDRLRTLPNCPLPPPLAGPLAARSIPDASTVSAPVGDAAPMQAHPPPSHTAPAILAMSSSPPPAPPADRGPFSRAEEAVGLTSLLPSTSMELGCSVVTGRATVSELGESVRVHAADTQAPCGIQHATCGDGAAAVPTGDPQLAAVGQAAVSPLSSPLSLVGVGPLQQLRRLVQNLVTRGDAVGGGAATAAAPLAEPAAPNKSYSRETSACGAPSTLGPISDCSFISRSSDPRLSSYQSHESGSARAAVAAAASAMCGRRSAGQQCAATGPAGADAAQRRASFEASTSHMARGRAYAGTTAVHDSWGCVTALAPSGHHLVSADCVLDHPQSSPALAEALAQLRGRHYQTSRRQEQQQLLRLGMGVAALSTDNAGPRASAGGVLQGGAAEQGGRTGGQVTDVVGVSGAAGTAVARAVSGGCKAAAGLPLVPDGSAAAAASFGAPPPALGTEAQVAAAAATRYVTSDSSAAAIYSPFSTTQVAQGASLEVDSRTPRCYALAKALTARGGSNAVYGAPTLRHSRCSIKLGGLTPADLPYDFVHRVASMLAAAGGSAAGQPTAAPAAVGVYVREGCVELVADVLVPVGAAEAEALVVGLAANTAVNARGDIRGRSSGGTGAAALARMLAVAEDTVGAAAAAAQVQQQLQHQPMGPAAAAAAASVNPDRAAAEAMLDLLERSLLPQISDAVSWRPSAQGTAAAVAPVTGNVAVQATVGQVQAMAWIDAQPAATPSRPRPPPPPPVIVCVTPCCVPLNQASGDDTRDRRRQTLTLTVALAGFGISTDAGRPPRVLVRHSGRCLAALVRPCADRYADCFAVTVELALSGVRPGLMFLEVAAEAGGGGGGAASAAPLSLPWPVLVVGDARVAAEVMQLQQQLEVVAPLRALQAEAELRQYLCQTGGNSSNGSSSSSSSSSSNLTDPQVQQQQQLPRAHPRHPLPQPDGGTTSLLLDLGMWLEAVSAADGAVITAAAAAAQPAFVSRDAAAVPRRLALAAQLEAAPPLPPPPPALLTPSVTAPAAEAMDESDLSGETTIEEGALQQQRGSCDGSSWESSEEEVDEVAEPVAASAVTMAAAAGAAAAGSLPRRPTRPLTCGAGSPVASSGCSGGADGGADSADADAEVQMLLLRGLQPEQELLEGSLDCAAEFEQTCRQGAALQSMAAGLGMRLLRFAVLRGWPATGTLLLRGLTVHCRLSFPGLLLLFPAGLGGGGSAAGMPLLHTAVMSGSLAMVRVVKAWAQRYRCPLPWDESVAAAGGLTPLHLAAVQENGRLAGAILGLWPDAEALWAVSRDRDGRTPQEYAYMRAMSSSASAASSSAACSSTSVSGKAATTAPALRPPSPPPQLPSHVALAGTTAGGGVAVAAVQAAPPQELESQQQQQVAQVAGIRRPSRQPQDGHLARELEEPLGELRPRAARLHHPQQPLHQLQLQQSQRALGLAEAAAAAGASTVPTGRPYVVALTPPTLRPQRPLSPATAAVGTGDGGGVEAGGGAGSSDAAGVRGDDPGSSSACSVFMTSMGPGATCPGNAFGRFDKTSDCGSMSMGPDSQWSHSTNATAQMLYHHLTTGIPQDLRSPVQVPGVPHTLNATLLSLANLPDTTCNSSSGAAATAIATAASTSTYAGAGAPGGGGVSSSGAATDGCGAAFLSVGGRSNGSAETHLQDQLLALATRHQHHQQRLAQQQPQHQQLESGRIVRAAFQLEAHGASKAAPQLPGPLPQLQHLLRQQRLLQAQQLHQQQPFLASHPVGQVPLSGAHPRLSGAAQPAPAAISAPPAAAAAGPSGRPTCSRPVVDANLDTASQPGGGGGGDTPAVCVGSSDGKGAGAGTSTDSAGAAAFCRSREPGWLEGATCAYGASDAEPLPAPVQPSGALEAVTRQPSDEVRHTKEAAASAAAAVQPSPQSASVVTAAALQAATATAKPSAAALPSQYHASGTAAPPASRFSTRGVRLLATTLLDEGGALAGSAPCVVSPPGSSGSPSSAAAAAAGGVTATDSTRSTATSAASTQSLTNTAARRRLSGDGRFSANTRRAAFADDYAPACQPTLAARTSRLAGLLPLLSAARHTPAAAADAGGGQAAAPGALLLAEARPVVRTATPSSAASGAAAAVADGLTGKLGEAGRPAAEQVSGALDERSGSGSGGGDVGCPEPQLDSVAETVTADATKARLAGHSLRPAAEGAAAQALPRPPPAVGDRTQALPTGLRETEASVAAAPCGRPPQLWLLLAGVVLLLALALPAMTRRLVA